LPIEGEFNANVEFSLLQDKVFHGPIVVADLPGLCILGMDFLSEIGAMLDLKHRVEY
jgi:hypothetical protein